LNETRKIRLRARLGFGQIRNSPSHLRGLTRLL
jgi:hypothetical protein